MAYHKVTLRSLRPNAERDGVVQGVASILGVSGIVAADMVANLPVVLAARTTLSHALTMKQIFTELGAEVVVDPPWVDFTDAEILTEPLQKKKTVRKWGALVLVAGIMGLASVALVFGGLWIMDKVHPETSEVEKRSKELEDSLSKDPRNAELLVRKAAAWIAIARQKMAQDNWKTYAKPGHVPYEGKDLLTLPEADTALQALLKAKSISPQNPGVYFWLGELYLQKGLAPEAVEFAKIAVNLEDSNATFYNLLGSAYLEMENVGKAEIAFRRAYAVGPDYLPTYRNLGNLLLYHQRDTLQGLEWLYQYLAREPGTDHERYLLRKEMLSAAFALFNPPWYELFPPMKDFEAYERERIVLQRAGDQVRLARLYLSQGLTDAAFPILVQLQKDDNADPDVRKMLVCTFARMGLWDAAEAQLRQAEPLDIRDPFFPKNIGVIYKYYRLNHVKAKEMWDRYEGLGGDAYLPLIKRYSSR